MVPVLAILAGAFTHGALIATIDFKVLFVLVVLLHHRRKVVYSNVTENPTVQWTAQQIVEAFPWNSAPKYLLRWRTDLSLAMDSPDSRPVQPAEQGAIVEFQDVGGLHRHYERMAA